MDTKTVPKIVIAQWMLSIDSEEYGKRLSFPFTSARKVHEVRAILSDLRPIVRKVTRRDGIINMGQWRPWLDMPKEDILARIKEMNKLWKSELNHKNMEAPKKKTPWQMRDQLKKAISWPKRSQTS